MEEKQYKAFISYSHNDEEFGTWLHQELEKYKIPKNLQEDYPHFPENLYPIFRDRYELTAGDILDIEISKALKNSDTLIVICSIESAKSIWVNKEIVEFKMRTGENKIFPIIMDGIPFAKENDKFDDRLECFPEALKYKVTKEGNVTNEKTDIIASSIIEKGDGKELAKLKLVAGILNIPFGEFYRRDMLYREEELERIKKEKKEVEELKSKANQETLKAKNLLYTSSMDKGILYRDYLNRPLKSKFSFASAISQATNSIQEKNAEMVYKSLHNTLRLEHIIEYPNIEYASFSKNSKYILSYDNENIRLWNINSNKIKTFKHEKLVKNTIFNKNETLILSWSEDNSIKLWNFFDKSPIFDLQNQSTINKVIFTNDEKHIFILDDTLMQLWSIIDKKLLLSIPSRDIIDIEFNKDEKQLFSWDTYGNIKSWCTKTAKLIFFIDNHSTETSTEWGKLSPNGKYIINYGSDGEYDNYNIKLWSANTGKLLNTFPSVYLTYGITFNKNETKFLSWGHSGVVKLWDIKEKQALKTFNHNYRTIGAKFSKNEDYIFAWEGAWKFATNTTIKIWDKSDDKKFRYEFKHDNIITEAIFSKNEKYILAYDEDSYSKKGICKLWSMDLDYDISTDLDYNISTDNKDYLFTIKQKNISIINFSNDSKKIITLSHNKIKLWSIINSNCDLDNNHSFNTEERPNMYELTSKSKKLLLVWDGDTYDIGLWSNIQNKFLLTLVNDFPVDNVVFNSTEEKFIMWSGGKLILWDIKENKALLKVKINESIEDIKFSKNGEQILIKISSNVLSYDIYRKNKLPTQYYTLELEVETGSRLDSIGELEELSTYEWLEKKKKYEKILKEENQKL